MIETFWPHFLSAQVTWAVLAAILIPYVTWQWVKRPKNFPPGPIGLPVLGIAGSMTNRAEVALTKIGWKYGPIVGVKLLRKFTVVLNSVESINEALVKQGHIFSGRPDSIMFQAFTGGRGILAIDGARWKENRKFGTTILRKLGAGRAIMEETIVDEATYFCEALQIIKKKHFNIAKIITHSVANVICSLAFGERFNYDDLRFINTARALVDWFNDNSNTFMLLVFAPYLRHVWPFSKAVKSLQTSRDKLYSMLKPIIQAHKDTLDNYEYRDFIEAYLQKIQQTSHDPNSFYSDAELLGNVRDLFVGGTDTTVSTLRWSIVYLINRPHVQKKIQKEIDKVIGPDARPKMTHLEDMPYTNAFMTEMLRIRIPGPLGLAHRAMEATKLMGYDIPKDTQVITNFWAVHHDPKIWGDPEEFRPERFLDADGKFVKPTHLVAFSMGSRYCMGESIARMEFFIFVVVMLQRYHLLLARDDSPPINEECLRSGQFLVPPSHEMRVKERFSREKSIMEYNQQMWDD